MKPWHIVVLGLFAVGLASVIGGVVAPMVLKSKPLHEVPPPPTLTPAQVQARIYLAAARVQLFNQAIDPESVKIGRMWYAGDATVCGFFSGNNRMGHKSGWSRFVYAPSFGVRVVPEKKLDPQWSAYCANG